MSATVGAPLGRDAFPGTPRKCIAGKARSYKQLSCKGAYRNNFICGRRSSIKFHMLRRTCAKLGRIGDRLALLEERNAAGCHVGQQQISRPCDRAFRPAQATTSVPQGAGIGPVLKQPRHVAHLWIDNRLVRNPIDADGCEVIFR